MKEATFAHTSVHPLSQPPFTKQHLLTQLVLGIERKPNKARSETGVLSKDALKPSWVHPLMALEYRTTRELVTSTNIGTLPVSVVHCKD